MQTLPAQHADANPRRTSVLSESVNWAGWRALTYFLWDRDVMFQIETGKDTGRNGKRYLHARCIAKYGAAYYFWIQTRF